VTPERISRNRATWVSYAQIGAFGWFVYTFGPALALLRDEQHSSAFVMSLHMSVGALGTVIGGTVTNHLVLTFGRGRVLRYGALGHAASMTAMLLAHGPTWTLLASTAIGFFNALVVMMNTSFLDQEHGMFAPVALAEGNAFAALSGLIAPAVMGWFVSVGLGWRWGVAVSSIAFVLIELFRGDVGAFQLVDENASDSKRPLPRRYWFALATIACTAGAEAVLLLWSVDVMRDRAGLGDAAAVASASTLTAGIFLGRIVVARLAQRLSPEILLRTSLAVTVLAFFGFWYPRNAAAMLVSFFICGSMMAWHWPLGVSRMVKAAGDQRDRGSGLASYGTGGVGIVLPLLLGAVAQVASAHIALLLFPAVMLVAMAAQYASRPTD